MESGFWTSHKVTDFNLPHTGFTYLWFWMSHKVTDFNLSDMSCTHLSMSFHLSVCPSDNEITGERVDGELGEREDLVNGSSWSHN